MLVEQRPAGKRGRDVLISLAECKNPQRRIIRGSLTNGSAAIHVATYFIISCKRVQLTLLQVNNVKKNKENRSKRKYKMMFFPLSRHCETLEIETCWFN